MINPQLLRSDIEGVAKQLAPRGFKLDVDAYKSIESQRKVLQSDVEALHL